MQARCAICRDFFAPGGIAAVRCGHTFHQTCITEWFAHSKTCPTCRFQANNPEDLIKNLLFDHGHNGPITDDCKERARKMDEVAEKLNTMKQELDGMNNRLSNFDQCLTGLKTQIDTICRVTDELQATNARLVAENALLKEEQANMAKGVLGTKPAAATVYSRPSIRTVPPSVTNEVGHGDNGQHEASVENSTQGKSGDGDRKVGKKVRPSRRSYSVAFGSTYRSATSSAAKGILQKAKNNSKL